MNCPACKGEGRRIEPSPVGPMLRTCSACWGTGDPPASVAITNKVRARAVAFRSWGRFDDANYLEEWAHQFEAGSMHTDFKGFPR